MNIEEFYEEYLKNVALKEITSVLDGNTDHIEIENVSIDSVVACLKKWSKANNKRFNINHEEWHESFFFMNIAIGESIFVLQGDAYYNSLEFGTKF